ncbi:MAG: hypothetical protein ABI778_11425, partial [Ignavibacteriota bacterium]
ESSNAYPIYGGRWDRGGDFSGGGRYSFTSANGLTELGGGIELGESISDTGIFVASSPSFPTFGNIEKKYLFHGYSILDAYMKQRVRIGGSWLLSLRLNVVLNTGHLPTQKLLSIGGANPAAQERNNFWKSTTGINSHFSEQAHFLMEGGLGVRGDRTTPASSSSGGGFSAELYIPNPFEKMGGFATTIQPLLFLDAGGFFNDNQGYSGTADAGPGLKVDIIKWLPWQLQGVAEEYSTIPKIGIYFPIWFADGRTSSFAFRYAISLGTTF